MASNFATVKLNKRLVDAARVEAQQLHRSIAGQIEHWAALGRAIEGTQGFSMDRVKATLAGELKIEELTGEQQDAFFGNLKAAFDPPAPALEAGYAELGQRRNVARTRRRQAASRPAGSKSAA